MSGVVPVEAGEKSEVSMEYAHPPKPSAKVVIVGRLVGQVTEPELKTPAKPSSPFPLFGRSTALPCGQIKIHAPTESVGHGGLLCTGKTLEPEQPCFRELDLLSDHGALW